MIQADVFISGGGVAGLTAAAAFGAAGFTVVLADPTPPITDAATRGADLRTTAFLQPARQFLSKIGLWERLAPHAAPLQVMRIVDAGGPDPQPRVTRDFNAADISDDPFGWNLPNWLLRREILARLDDLPNVRLITGAGFKSALTRTAHARVTLTNGTRLSVQLVIGADGRSSPVREAAGIDARTRRYGQKALTFAVTHAAPHDNISTEVHRTGGPFTLVPLPDLEGPDLSKTPCSAVVWMENGPEIQRLAALTDDAFSAAATERSAGVMGDLTLASRRMIWPIISQTADALTAERTALIAEAAHVMPPIGAQGLNMSLADIEALLDLAKGAPSEIGSPQMLDRYARKREFDIKLRTTGIDLLNRASQAENPLFRDLRAKGVEVLYGLTPVRQAVMKMGLGTQD